jgi:translation elongation factor EF-4
MQLGILTPEMQPAAALLTGQVGYVITGLRSIKAARVGDTWQHYKAHAAPLPGFPPAKAMIFAGDVLPPSTGLRNLERVP